ncbi:MAG TPA: response regulator, partial [Pirellulales bacterium]|nr:response regulator [Pirellulales bacterium]
MSFSATPSAASPAGVDRETIVGATPATPAAAAQPRSSEPAGASARLLVVEDDPRSARLLQANLVAAGYRVILAADATTAKAEAAAHAPDLILSDICLPDEDGISLTRFFRQHPSLCSIPVVLVTSLDDRKVLGRALEAGADDFLTKPVNTVELRSRVRSLLRNKVLADELRAREQSALPFASLAADEAGKAADATAPTETPAPAASFTDCSILLVDDNDQERRLLEAYLTPLGCRIHTAADAASGLALLKQSPPDLVILDLLLPDASGFAVIEQMKAAPALTQVPILVVSGMAQVQDRVRALELGADDFIVKNFDRLEFEARVRRLLRLKQSLDQLNSRCHQALQQAITDSLTGMFTHGFLQETLGRQVACARRHAWPLSLLFIDIDRFKQINDQNGHAVGDDVLRALADKIRNNLRRSDIAVRYGGEEFVVLLPHTDRAGARKVAEELRCATERMAVASPRLGERTLKVTISLGVATFPGDADDGPALVERADEAMYRAKRGGRNQVIAYQSAPTAEHSKPRVLVVDDDERNVRLFEAYLAAEGYQTIKAFDGQEAVEIARRERPDLILLDGMMPRMTGFEACRRLKQDRVTNLIPIIIVTALTSREDRLQGIEAGADDFLNKPIDKVELVTRMRALLRAKQSTDQLEDADSVILTLARMVESRAPLTVGHVERVANYAVELGRILGLDQPLCESLRRAGFVHDIGKIFVPDAILLKPDKLTPEERRLMERHVDVGYDLLRPMRTFAEALPAVRFHHERLDGSGYPLGLRGTEIPLIAQIIALVDVYDALTTDRVYRPAMSRDEAFATLEEETNLGMHDPVLLDALVKLIHRRSPEGEAVCETAAAGA